MLNGSLDNGWLSPIIGSTKGASTDKDWWTKILIPPFWQPHINLRVKSNPFSSSKSIGLNFMFMLN